MTNHYYKNSPDLAHDRKTFPITWQGESFTFVTDAGVFSKGELDPGTKLLVESVPALHGRVADLGCGWGPVAVLLGRKYPQAHFALCDVNERALGLAKENLAKNGIQNARVFVSDGLAAVEPGLDFVLTNPPIRAGKAVVHGFFAQSYEKLAPGGQLFVVIRKSHGAPSAKAYIQELFGNCETIARGGGYHILQAKK